MSRLVVYESKSQWDDEVIYQNWLVGRKGRSAWARRHVVFFSFDRLLLFRGGHVCLSNPVSKEVKPRIATGLFQFNDFQHKEL